MLLTGIEIFEGFKTEFQSAERSIFLASAYCTKKAFDGLNSAAPLNAEKKALVVRWEPYDLLEGASDLEVYLSAKQFGWRLYINQRLHGKIAVVDDARVIMGSANCTESGLGLLGARSNIEANVKLPVNPEILKWQDDLLKSSVEITDELYELITKEISAFDPAWKPKIAFSFTDSLQQKMKEVHGGLFTKDFVWCNSPEQLGKQSGDDVNHDLELLRLTASASREEMRASFERLKIYRWLDENVETELYFGELTKMLHTDLQDDPKPYRKSVKILLANLINWTTFLFPDRFRQERPNYSTKIVRIQVNGAA